MLATLAPIWVTSRAAGVGALLAASLSTALGLATALRPAWLLRRRADVHVVHEALGIATLGLIAVHGLALLADPTLHIGLGGLLVPLAAPYRPVATALGQVAALGLAVLSLGYYARRRLGTGRWRSAHRWAPAFWALAVLHGLLTGSDAGRWWFLLASGIPAVTAVALLVERHGDRLLAPPEDDGGARL
jgi:sulfoxide reductase heme-binding subunit YedZ